MAALIMSEITVDTTVVSSGGHASVFLGLVPSQATVSQESKRTSREVANVDLGAMLVIEIV